VKSRSWPDPTNELRICSFSSSHSLSVHSHWLLSASANVFFLDCSMAARRVFSLSLLRKPSMSVSHTGSMASRLLTAFRVSNFWDSLGTSNPREPSSMAL
jgi:hypothetical protein